MTLASGENDARPRRTNYGVVLGLILLAFIARSVFPELRPFHNDEGVNYHFIRQIENLGYYPYSHENYHGPSYFYLTYFITRFVGYGMYGFRLSAVLASLALIPLLLLIRSHAPRFFLPIAGLLIALSSSVVFYGRYAIHESLLVLASLGFALSVYCWHRGQSRWPVYLGAVSVALLITTKETFVVTLASVFPAFLSLGQFQQVMKKIYQQQNTLCAAGLCAILLIIACYTGGFRWYGGLQEMLLSIPQWMGRNESDTGHFKPVGYYLNVIRMTEPYLVALVLLPVMTLIELIARAVHPQGGYATGLQSPLLKTEGQSTVSWLCSWLALILVAALVSYLHLTVVHYQAPWLLSFSVMTLSIILGWCVISFREPLERFFLIWGITGLFIYSTLNYKTPWLIINFTVPLLLALGCWLSQLLDSERAENLDRIGLGILLVPAGCWVLYDLNLSGSERMLVWVGTASSILIFIAAVLLPAARSLIRRLSGPLLTGLVLTSVALYSWKYNVTIPYGSGNPFSYVHTSQGMIDLVDDLKEYWETNPTARVLIGVSTHWPLPYYLREYKDRVGYIQTDNADAYKQNHGVMVLSQHSKWRQPGWVKKYYRLSDVQESNTYFKLYSGKEP